MTNLRNDRTFVTMAYDENLADRIRDILDRERVPYEEKRMMGGLCFLVRGKMCMGVEKKS